MKKIRIVPPKDKMGAEAHPKWFTYGFIAEGTPVFLSGVVSRDAQNKPYGVGNMKMQLRNIYKRIKWELETVGLGPDNVVWTEVHVTDMEHYIKNDVGSVHSEFCDPPPASTLIEINRLRDPALMIEVTAFAMIPPGWKMPKQ